MPFKIDPKVIYASLLIGIWTLLVVTGYAAQPTGERLIDAIQALLTGLGIYHVTLPRQEPPAQLTKEN